MKVKLYGLLIALIVCFKVAELNAQPNETPHNPGEPVPITGLEYLLIGGGIYGIYRFVRKPNKNDEV